MITISEYLAVCNECRSEWTTAMWERAEKALLDRVVMELWMALGDAGIAQEPSLEPLVEVIAGEEVPDMVKFAIEDACERLIKQGAILGKELPSAALKEAAEHALNFLQNKRQLLEDREREIQEKAVASAMHLMKVFTSAGVW